jgi:hypothetical protein
MYVVGSFLKESILYDLNLTKNLIREITSQNIYKYQESNLEFGYGYYKPVVFLECQNYNNEEIYLAFQEVYESTMETITISEFLLKNNQDKNFVKEILVCINYSKGNKSKEFIEKKVYDKKIVFTLNIFNYPKEESVLKDFCLLIQNPLDESILDSNYDMIKDLAFRISVKMNKNKMLVDALEKGFRDRANEMVRSENRSNILFNKAVEMYCKSDYTKEFICDIFSEYEGEEFTYYLDLFKKEYEKTIKLLEAGVEKDIIIDDLKINRLIFV